MLSWHGSIYMKNVDVTVVQITPLIGQLINPNNVHVSRNLSILIVA